MIRNLLAAVLCAGEVLAPALARAQALTATVNCAGPRLDGAEREICAAPELGRLNDAVDSLTRRLESRLTGEDRAALIATERPFVIERNNCQNDASGVRACVEHVLRGRAAALTASLHTPAAIRDEIARYTFLDLRFFRRYGEDLAGKRIRLFGCMLLAPGPKVEERVHGTIRASCQETEGLSVPVIFTRMDSTSAIWFFDAKRPVGYWQGTVQRAGGTLVLAGVEP